MAPFLDQEIVSQALFYPRRQIQAAPHNAELLAVMVEPSLLVYGYLHLAAEAAPLLLLFHGNGELAADYNQVAGLFTELGFSLLVMDYRGYGISDGEPSTRHLLADAVTIFDALPELLPKYGSHPKQTFVMGRSLGSAAACELAQRRGERLAGLVIESGFAFTGRCLLVSACRLVTTKRVVMGSGMERRLPSSPVLL
jgi:hypothetical protein